MLSKTISSKVFILLMLLPALSACDAGLRTMEAGEYGVVFNKLPPMIGGGVSSRVIPPGESKIIFPVFQKLIPVDTKFKLIGWGGIGEGDNSGIEDYVETRAADGNEVGLAITIRYQVDPQKVAYVVQRVGDSNEKIRELVSAVARADIRTHMNILNTKDFFLQEKAPGRQLRRLKSLWWRVWGLKEL